MAVTNANQTERNAAKSSLEMETLSDCLTHYLPVSTTTVNKKLFQQINFCIRTTINWIWTLVDQKKEQLLSFQPPFWELFPGLISEVRGIVCTSSQPSWLGTSGSYILKEIQRQSMSTGTLAEKKHGYIAETSVGSLMVVQGTAVQTRLQKQHAKFCLNL